MKKFLSIIMAALLLGMGTYGTVSQAASAMIEFSAANKQVSVGERITVVCTVKASAAFTDADFYISYDSKFLKFETGGDKVSGSNGVLHAVSTGNTDEVTKRVFSLSFLAKKEGNASVSVSNKAKVITSDNSGLSVSSNRITVNVLASGEGQQADGQQADGQGGQLPDGQGSGTTPPGNTDTTVSNNTKLKELDCSGLNGLNPKFDAKVTQYETSVNCRTNTLYFSFQTANKNAKVSIDGNKELKEGRNEVKVTVTAASGKQRIYQIAVKKESEEETKEREWREKTETNGVNFHVIQKDGKTLLQNTYEFIVLDVIDETTIPSGYVKTKIRIEGVEMPAYTMKSDMENNYLLLYLQGPNGEKNVYQYDRSEKTIQRYTGDMIERINKSGEDGYVTKEPSTSSNQTVLLTVIVVFVVVMLCMLGYILKLIGKNRKIKQKTNYDDLDF